MTSVSRTPVLFACILFFCLAFGCTQQRSEKDPHGSTAVTIAGSHLRTMKSASTGRNYDLYVHLPSDYEKNTSKKYPVLYILDAQWDFKLLDSVLGGLVYDKFVPEIIMVGITYSGENPDYNGLRAMDLTPVAVDRVKGSGGGPKFYKFLKSEAVPFVEKNYRADASKRFLQGSSYAGLFTLYAMFNDPEFFAGYISASPDVAYDDGYEFREDAEYARTHKDLKAKLYLGVGGDEELTKRVREFMQTLDSHHYKGLKLETRVLDGERHASNKPELFNRGLRYVLAE
jgi:predicted alpha/beta superfamily hydrolase